MRRFRVAAVLALTVVMPVLFFTYVPANGLSALFFDRYMLPALPAFLILVAVAIATVSNWAGRARLLVFGILGLVFKYQSLGPRLSEGLTVKPFLLPMIVFIGAVLGLIYQQHRASNPVTAGAAPPKK